MEMKDLTLNELVKYFKDELHQDITLEEAQSMKEGGGKYAKIFNTEAPDHERHITVLKSYDEDIIKEAIEKNHLLDLKNLSEEDVKKTVMFLMEKSKEFKPDAPYYTIEEKHKSTMLVLDSQVSIRKTPIQKQPDYRKFEKNKRS